MLSIFGLLNACILGAFIGKFLAAVVYHLPKVLLEESVEEKEPREIFKLFLKKQNCQFCRYSFRWWENFPLFGYLFLRGKCQKCQNPLSLRTFLVELGTSILFGASEFFFTLNATLFFVLIVSCIMICCFVTDFEHSILPDQFTLTMIWMGLIASLFPIFVSPSEAIIGAVGGYGIFWLFNEMYRYYRGFDGMYPGDFKLNAGIGACLGLKWLMIILTLSMFLLLFVTAIRFFTKPSTREGILHEESPYGCYSSVVTVAALYLSLLGTSI